MQMPRLVQVWASLKADTAAVRCASWHLDFSSDHTRGSVNRSAWICLQPPQRLRACCRKLLGSCLESASAARLGGMP